MLIREITGGVRTVATRPAHQAVFLTACATFTYGLLSLGLLLWILFGQSSGPQHWFFGMMAMWGILLFTIVAAALANASRSFLSYARIDGFPRPVAVTAGRIGGALLLLAVPVVFVDFHVSLTLFVGGFVGSIVGSVLVPG